MVGRRDLKLPKKGKAKRMIMQANKDAAEAYFSYVFLITHTYNRLLAYIANHNLQMNEPNRKECSKDLKKTIIPDIEEAVGVLKASTGSGNVIPNGLMLAAEKALTLSQELRAVCDSGNFSAKGWTEKLKMFEYFEKNIDTELERIFRVFKEGTHPGVRDEVLNDIAHLYLNPCRDLKDHARMGAHS